MLVLNVYTRGITTLVHRLLLKFVLLAVQMYVSVQAVVYCHWWSK